MNLQLLSAPRWLALPALLCLALTLQFCSSSKKAATAEASVTPTVFYAKDIKPIMLAKCAPCHFPETGKKMPLDTYEAVRDNIQDILRRVQLPQDHMGFMPFKNKKEPLTAAEIQLLKDWVAGQMPG